MTTVEDDLEGCLAGVGTSGSHIAVAGCMAAHAVFPHGAHSQATHSHKRAVVGAEEAVEPDDPPV